jgi:hypothetical protein
VICQNNIKLNSTCTEQCLDVSAQFNILRPITSLIETVLILILFLLSSNVADVLTFSGFGWAQVLLRDPSDENVIPVVEELRRRLAPSGASHLDGKDNLSGQHDGEGAEDDGKFSHHSLKLQLLQPRSFICQVSLYL